MHKHFFAFLLLLTFAVCTTNGQVRIVQAQNSALVKDSYVFIEHSGNDQLRNQLIQSLSTNPNFKVFINETDKTAPIIITQSRKGLVKDNAGRDCLIGIGACTLGGLFVQASGQTLDEANPPTGFFATVGDKYVEGSGAVFTGAIWLGGCIFGIKGIIELFKPRTQEKAVQNSLNFSNMSADKIISASMLLKLNEKEFGETESNPPTVVAFVNTLLY